MRWVTVKPPTMLMVASRMAAAASRVTAEPGGPDTCSMPPIRMMPLIALVTLISGVCSAGVTFHTTCQPTKQASMKMVRWEISSLGATEPSRDSAPSTSTATTASRSGRLGAGPASLPCLPFLAACASEGAGGALIGAAGGGLAGFGGGHISSPSCSTRAPRTTGSSRSTCQLLAPPMSARRWVRFEP